MTRPPTAAPIQRVCPRCARLAHTDARTCPFCGGRYRRNTLLWIAVLLVVFAAGILGGVAAMLTVAGDRARDEVDSRVQTIQRQIDDSVRQAGDDVVDEIDRRLAQGGSATP